MKKTFSLTAEQEWAKVAAYLLEVLRPGDVITLQGNLGVGKTTCVQALAHALGGKERPRSPTFALVRTYPVQGPRRITRLVHVDAYRLEKPEEALALGLEEERETPGTVLAIEWPERLTLPAAFSKRLITLSIEHGPEGVRDVQIALQD